MDGNLLLTPLPMTGLSSSLETVPLHGGQRLFEAGETVRHAWFPTSGLISLLGASGSGGLLELAMIGADGVVGLPLIRRGAIASHVAVVQVAGSAVRLDARALEAATRTSEVLQNALQQYARGVIAATFQGVLCNHFHEVLPRFCRWLLAASDRLQTDRFDVTHETLSNVLGVRRAAVSIAASELQDAEAIHCRYGRIAIVNRRRLERSACECYEVLREDG